MQKLETSASPLSIFTVIAVGIVAGAQLLTTIAASTPATAGESDYWVFFVSLFVLATAALTLLWYAAQRVFGRRRIHAPNFYRCLRQASLLSGIVTFALFLNSINVFQLWDIFPLVVAGVLIEFFFQAEKRPHASLRHAPSETE